MGKIKTLYEEIVDVTKIASPGNSNDWAKIASLAIKDKLTPANGDGKKTLLLVIDQQNDFMPNIGSLGVPGADADIERLTKFMYNNMGSITQVMCSLDTHAMGQIFHPCWWVGKDGNPPDPFTVISVDDLDNGVWRPVYGKANTSVDYVKQLAALGKQQLMIWPYHCLQGTYGASLESEFTNMMYFHSIVRAARPQMIAKGFDMYSEMYGIIKPEYNPNNLLNTSVLQAIEKHDQIFLAGQAASHCVAESGAQILEYFKDRPEITTRITLLKDCTSAVTGCEQMAADAFSRFESQFGVKVANSVDIQL